jgi:hypothetical protein
MPVPLQNAHRPIVEHPTLQVQPAGSVHLHRTISRDGCFGGLSSAGLERR